MNFIAAILILMSAGCMAPPKSASRQSQPDVVVQPPAFDPPDGVMISVPAALQGVPSDFFTAPNPNGPWTYRTDDLRIWTNTDGTTWGYFTNTPPGAMQEFYLIVPLGFPLPENIVTNS
jgi:hypothetical protein